LAPRGAVAELLEETRAGFVAPNHDIEAIKRAFLECYEKFGYREETFEPNDEAIKRYERREITNQLAVLLDTARAQRQSSQT
jgi:hypothetical protein